MREKEVPMRDKEIPGWAPAIAAVGTVASLFAPWMRSGQRDRSSIELLDSASALRVLEGSREWVAVVSWAAVPVLTGLALVAIAWGRTGFSAWLVLPIAPLMVAASVIVATSPFDARWGAGAGAALGLTTTTLAGLILLSAAKWRRAEE